MKTANARYRAKVGGSSIDMEASELPLDLHQLIVWVMHSENAAYLLPEYQKLRQQETERDESQRTHCGLDI